MLAGSVFDQWAAQYDRSRKQLIPCFDAFYQAALNQLPFNQNEAVRILDLGAGTGLLSAFIQGRFSNSTLTMLDMSREMLQIARARFRKLRGQVDFIVGDYSKGLPDGPFHAVVSALSIHHLAETDKLRLFEEVPRVLLPRGVFLNADQVLGSTPDEERWFCESWIREVQELGVSKADLEAAFERMKDDKMSTLEVQLSGLRAAGFGNVECAFQDKSFVVYSGRLRAGAT